MLRERSEIRQRSIRERGSPCTPDCSTIRSGRVPPPKANGFNIAARVARGDELPDPVADLRHAADRSPASVGNKEIELLPDREGLRAAGDACGIPIAVLPRVHRVFAEGRRRVPYVCHRGILAVSRATADTKNRDHQGAKPPGARGRGSGGIGRGSWGEKRDPQASFETGTTPAYTIPVRKRAGCFRNTGKIQGEILKTRNRCNTLVL